MTKLKGLGRKVVNREPRLSLHHIPRRSVKIRTPTDGSEMKLQVVVGSLLHKGLQEVVDHLQKGHLLFSGVDRRTDKSQVICKTISRIECIHGLNEASQQNRQELMESMRI